MKRFTVAVVALSGCILGPACQAIVGIEDRVEAPPLDDASVPDVTPTPDAYVKVPADAGSDAECPPNATECNVPDAAPPQGCPTGCLPPAPAGWKGPSATYDGAESTKPAACPGGYTEKEVEAHQGMTATPAACDCGTPVITGRKCTSTVLSYTNSICSQNEAAVAKVSSCAPLNNIPDYYKLGTPSFAAGTCTYPNAKANAPAPSFAKVDVSCGQPAPALCAGRSDCIATPEPSVPFGRLCIHKDGDVACPAEDYKARFVAFKGIDDGRTCTACSGTASSGTCGTAWGLRGNQLDCAFVPSPTDRSVNTCYSYTGGINVVDTTGFQPASGSCTTTTGTPTGIASSIDPVTFCCNF